MQQTKQSNQETIFLGGIITAILVALTILGGTPEEGSLSLYWFGAIVTIGVTVLIGLVGWHLLIRPLPEGHKSAQELLITGTRRHLIGLVMLLGVVNIAVGSAWDEIWHSKYGLPFGEDFFWRPHQMIYFGFIVTILVAAYGMYLIMTQAKGSFQQRFRSDPSVGFAILTGAYLAYALPADPLWHNLYGEDIAAWSLPHIVLLVLVLIMGISAIIMQRSLDTKREWALLTHPRLRDILASLLFSSVLLSYVIVLTSEWYVVAQYQTAETEALFTSRPDWLVVALVALASSFIGGLVLHATRRVGTALLVALMALLIRVLVELFVTTPYSGLAPFGIVIPVMMGLEVAYFYAHTRNKSQSWLLAGIASGAFIGLISLFVIDRFFIYPEVTITSSISMIIAGILTTALGVRIAQIVGSYFSTVEAKEGDSILQITLPRWLDGVVYAGFALFALFLMFTAAPPI